MRRLLGIATTTALVLSACDEEAVVTGSGNAGDPTNDRMQSETSIAVSPFQGGANVVITYNDDTGEVPTFIEYTAGSRLVKFGASQMGWSLSSDAGRTWTYKGKLRPPAGSAALWGDPSVAATTLTSGIQGIAFMTNLELPASKFPSGGITGSVIDFLGGAVIARSLDGGQTFSIVQTVRNGSGRYDGSAMAMSASGRVCAAYNNLNTEKIDVWCAEGALNTFVRKPDPFGDNLIVASHPRLKALDDGTMYLAAWAQDATPAQTRRIVITKWDGTGWTFPVFANDPLHPPENRTRFLIGDRSIRTANQFAFTVGPPSFSGANDEVRVVYASLDPSGNAHLFGSSCGADLGTCLVRPQWTTGAWSGGAAVPGQQFGPKLAVSPDGTYKLIYYSTQDDLTGHTLSAKEGNLAFNATTGYLFQPFDFVPTHEVCPAGTGYWGDYDYAEFNRFDPSTGVAEFIVGRTSSQRGCVQVNSFDSTHQHVSVAFTQ